MGGCLNGCILHKERRHIRETNSSSTPVVAGDPRALVLLTTQYSLKYMHPTHKLWCALAMSTVMLINTSRYKCHIGALVTSKLGINSWIPLFNNAIVHPFFYHA